MAQKDNGFIIEEQLETSNEHNEEAGNEKVTTTSNLSGGINVGLAKLNGDLSVQVSDSPHSVSITEVYRNVVA